MIVGGVLVCGFFFFSSRRRHTRWPRDWSSDVCSSDLDEKKRVTRAQPSLPPHRTDCPAEESSADRRACRAGEIRRGELQEPSPRSLPIVRIVPGGRGKRGPPPRREDWLDSLRFTGLTGRAWSSSSSSSTSVRLTPVAQTPNVHMEHLQPPTWRR